MTSDFPKTTLTVIHDYHDKQQHNNKTQGVLHTKHKNTTFILVSVLLSMQMGIIGKIS